VGTAGMGVDSSDKVAACQLITAVTRATTFIRLSACRACRQRSVPRRGIASHSSSPCPELRSIRGDPGGSAHQLRLTRASLPVQYLRRCMDYLDR
jgi:hypothetical protein